MIRNKWTDGGGKNTGFPLFLLSQLLLFVFPGISGYFRVIPTPKNIRVNLRYFEFQGHFPSIREAMQPPAILLKNF